MRVLYKLQQRYSYLKKKNSLYKLILVQHVSLKEKFLWLFETNLGQNLTQQILITHLWKYWATGNVAVDDKQANVMYQLFPFYT